MEPPLDHKKEHSPTDDAKYKREVLANELAHRRERRQQIFSWASSLLVAIIGGTIALTYTKQVLLGGYQKLLLDLASLIVGLDAIFWIRHHWRPEKTAKQYICEYSQQLGIPEVETKRHREDWASLLTLLVLTAAAMVTPWVPILPAVVSPGAR